MMIFDKINFEIYFEIISYFEERESMRESLFTSFTRYRYLSYHTFDYLFAMLYSGLFHHCPCEKSIACLLLPNYVCQN